MSDWATQLSDASITAFNKETSTTGLLQQYHQSFDYQADVSKINASSQPGITEMDSMNTWLWKTDPSQAYFKLALSNAHPLYISRGQLLIGGAGTALLLFMLLK